MKKVIIISGLLFATSAFAGGETDGTEGAIMDTEQWRWHEPNFELQLGAFNLGGGSFTALKTPGADGYVTGSVLTEQQSDTVAKFTLDSDGSKTWSGLAYAMDWSIGEAASVAHGDDGVAGMTAMSTSSWSGVTAEFKLDGM